MRGSHRVRRVLNAAPENLRRRRERRRRHRHALAFYGGFVSRDDLCFDVGANWNVSDKTQLYAKVDNVTNIRPPDTGGQNANNTLYDVIGRMYRVGVRFSN